MKNSTKLNFKQWIFSHMCLLKPHCKQIFAHHSIKAHQSKSVCTTKAHTNAKPKAKKQRYFLVNKTAFILPFICCHCRYMKMVEDCMRKLTKPVISQISVLSAICLVSAHSPRFYLLKLVQ